MDIVLKTVVVSTCNIKYIKSYIFTYGTQYLTYVTRINFRLQLLYSYSKNDQSEQCIYYIMYSDYGQFCSTRLKIKLESFTTVGHKVSKRHVFPAHTSY